MGAINGILMGVYAVVHPNFEYPQTSHWIKLKLDHL